MALFKVNTPFFNCCDLKDIGGENSRVSTRNGTCVFISRYAQRADPTPSQVERRTVFKSVTDLWVSFSSPQKQEWNDFALIQPLQNACGDTIFESGFLWFARINGVLVNFGTDKMLSVPPADYDPPAQSIPLALIYNVFCFFPVPVLVGTFSAVPGLGLEVFGLVGNASTESKFALKSNLLFASDTVEDPIYGDPPDPSISPSVLMMWFLSLRLAWHFKFRPVRGAAQPPPLGV